MTTPEEKEDAPRKTRERKATKHFEVVVKEKKEIELGGGSGTKLGAIPVILYYINHLNGSKILLFLLDKMLYIYSFVPHLTLFMFYFFVFCTIHRTTQTTIY
jgi:hypothetical protein